MKLHDITLLILSSLTGVIGWSLPALLEGQIWFIIGFILAMFTPVTRVAIRTLISQCVSKDEVGSIFGLDAVIGAVSSSLVTATFDAIYKATLEIYASAFLLINAGLMLLTIPLNIFARIKL